MCSIICWREGMGGSGPGVRGLACSLMSSNASVGGRSCPGYLQRGLRDCRLVVDQSGQFGWHLRRPSFLDPDLGAVEGAHQVVLSPLWVEVEVVEAPMPT